MGPRALSILTHMVIDVCSAKLMESLDSPPKAMPFLVYIKIFAIAHASYDNKKVVVTSGELFPIRGNIRP